MKCRHCGQPIYLYEYRWRHTNGFFTCIKNVPHLGFRAEPEEEKL